VTQNGTISRTDLLAKYSSNAGADQELIAVIEAGINVCIGNDGLATQLAKPSTMVKQECESNSALVFSCVYREIFLVSSFDKDNITQIIVILFFAFRNVQLNWLLTLNNAKSLKLLLLNVHLHRFHRYLKK
jgi:hypothetical protein